MSESINAEFEAYVKAELGDIAVVSEGRFISPKIQNYYKIWNNQQTKITELKSQVEALKQTDTVELYGMKDGIQVHLPDTKTDKSRDVPLSKVGKRLLDRMRGFDPELVFGLTSQTRDALFRKYRDRAGIQGLTWHDLRHSAATRLGKAGSLSVLELCKVFGWSNPAQAMQYFNPTVQDLAAKL